jgi:predicted RNA binding protein YcfA (HicA-like mRNA interferase family)
MKSNELLKLLNKSGWKTERQSGSHLILKHHDRKELIVFPNHGSKEVGKGLEMKIKKIARIK